MKKLMTLIVFMSICLMLYSQPYVSKIEYFFDTDPGMGLANILEIGTPQANTVDINRQINCNNLNNGLHSLYVRAMNSNSVWGIPQMQMVYIQRLTSDTTRIASCEYFFDSDPGLGKAEKITFFAAKDILINTSISLKKLNSSLHTLYVRTMDAKGRWGIPQSQSLVLHNISSNSQIASAEYFFDTDPGFGKAQKVPVTVGADVLVSTLIYPNFSFQGLHYLYFRTQDTNGTWSVPQYQMVLVNNNANTLTVNKIVYLEYFFNTDPGFGKGTSINITPSEDITSSVTLPFNTLKSGINTLLMRVKDDSGKWSIPIEATFQVLNTGINSSGIYNDENVFTIYGGRRLLTISTPQNNLNCKYLARIYALNGNLLMSKNANSTIQIEMNKGLYLVELSFGNEKQIQKVLIY